MCDVADSADMSARRIFLQRDIHNVIVDFAYDSNRRCHELHKFMIPQEICIVVATEAKQALDGEFPEMRTPAKLNISTQH